MVLAFLVGLVYLEMLFSVPVPVYAEAPGSGWVADRLVYPSDEPDRSPSMATDSNGYLYVVFEHYDRLAELYKIIVSRSTDGGDTWSKLVSWSSTKEIGHPSMAIDPYDDSIYIAYQREYADGDYDIFATVYRPTTGWQFWIEVDADADNDRFPSITSEYWRGSYNRQYIAYENFNTNGNMDLMFAKSIDHGETWSVKTLRGEGEGGVYVRPSITVARGSDGQSYTYIAYGQGGSLYYEWYLYVDISNDGGSSWTQKRVFDGRYDFVTVHRPSIVATHGGGTVVVAWENRSATWEPDISLYYAYSIDDGDTWQSKQPWDPRDPGSPLVPLGLARGVAPTLTVDGQGSISTVYGYIHVIYYSASDIRYRKAHYADPSSWSDPQIINDYNRASERAISDRAGLGLTTQQRPDGEWYPTAAWTDFRSSGPSLNDAPAFWDIYYSTPGAIYTIDTLPSGLLVEVDGSDYTAPESFNWIAGYSHTIYAPSPQSGGTGIEYRLWGWSDSGTQSHSITVSDVDTTITASYVIFYYVTVEHSGIETAVTATVDGRSYDLPVGFWWEEGSDHEISIPSTIEDPTISGKRYAFTRWSGLSDSTSETITFLVATTGTLTANYKTQYYLTMNTNFGSVSPGNGWHDKGSTIDILAEAPTARSGERYVWKGWTGTGYESYAGMDNPASITISEPITQEASWTRQWYIKVTSAHGEPTPSQWIDEGKDLTASVTSPTETVSGQTQWRCTGYSVDGDETQLGTSYTLENVKAPHEIEFYWVQQFWLQVDTTVSGSTVEGTGWYDVGTPVTISTTPYQPSSTHQFVFTLWTSTGTNEAPITDPVSSSTTVTMNNYHTVQANWQEQWYITIISLHNTPTPSQWINTSESLTVSVTSPSDDDGTGTRYRCIGYRIDEGDLQKGTSHVFENVQTPHKIEFEWTPQYQLTIINSGHGITSPVTGNWYDAGEWVTITISPDTTSNTTNTRYLFDSWTGTGLGSYTGSENPHQVQMNAPITEVASWKAQYYLTVNSPHATPSGADWYDENSLAYATLDTQTVSGGTGIRHVFTHWSGDTSGTDYSQSDPITMNAPKTATASWKTQYHLTIETDPIGLNPQPNVSIAGPWYDSGTQLTLTAETVDGYVFDWWEVDGTSRGAGVNPVTLTMDGPHTAIAHYALPAFPLALVLVMVLMVVIATMVVVFWYMKRRRVQGKSPRKKLWFKFWRWLSCLG
jgi:hypothetical protein